MTRIKPSILITSTVQVMHAIRWDGSDEVFDMINALCPTDHDLSMTVDRRIEVLFPSGHTKWLDPGNYLAVNKFGNVVLLHHSTVQNQYEEIRPQDGPPFQE
jgi:hypothetical protein